MSALGKADEVILKAVDELLTVLDSHDTEMIAHEQMQETFNAWDELHGVVKCQIKESIMALTEERDKEEESVEAVTAGHTSAVEEIAAQRLATEKHLEEVEQQVKELRAKLEDSRSDAEKLQEKYRKVKEDMTQELASLRHTTNLYSLISNIRWKYDTDPDEISGYVSNKANVKPFQLNTKHNSRFFITNYIWDLIDSQ